MNYLKNLIKILLLTQCLLLFCVCDKKEVAVVETTEQNILNLADFTKCPFNEKFDNKTDLEKYVLKKFGKTDRIDRRRGPTAEHSVIIADKTNIRYENVSFLIYKGVNKKFNGFKEIFMSNFINLKYGINNETTTKDIEGLFGQPIKIEDIKKKENEKGNDTIYYYYREDGPYSCLLEFRFRREKLNYMAIRIHNKDWIKVE